VKLSTHPQVALFIHLTTLANSLVLFFIFTEYCGKVVRLAKDKISTDKIKQLFCIISTTKMWCLSGPHSVKVKSFTFSESPANQNCQETYSHLWIYFKLHVSFQQITNSLTKCITSKEFDTFLHLIYFFGRQTQWPGTNVLRRALPLSTC
jgi:hypothetical protein